MENPDLVLQEKGSSSTHSRFDHVPSGDTLRRDAMSSFNYSFPVFALIFNEKSINVCLLQIMDEKAT